MTGLDILVYINNVVCVIALGTCFFHALHSGLPTANFTKAVLYLLGLGFYSSIITDRTKILIPGHEYVMIVTIIFATFLIGVFLFEYQRFGYASRLRIRIQSLLRGLVQYAPNSKK